jgi:hypothetical protein
VAAVGTGAGVTVDGASGELLRPQPALIDSNEIARDTV